MRNYDSDRAFFLTLALWIIVFLLIFTKLVNPTQITIPDVEGLIKQNSVKVEYRYWIEDKLGNIHWGLGYCVGILIEPNKVLTVCHVVNNKPSGKILIWFWNPETEKFDISADTDAKVLKFDTDKDLMLLEIKTKPNWKTIRLAEELIMGEKIIFFGRNRLGLPDIRYSTLMIEKGRLNQILVDPIFFGDSGGAVCNSMGQLIGIITDIYIDFYGPLIYNPLIGGAIPLSEIKEFLK